MAYVLNVNLTDAYIQSLITRNGYTDVSHQSPYDEAGLLYVIQDLNGNINGFGDMPTTRDWLVQQYLIIQNS